MVDPLAAAAKIATELAEEIQSNSFEWGVGYAMRKLQEHRVKAFLSEMGSQVSRRETVNIDRRSTDERMREYLIDPKKREIFMESYRRVFFTASKELGPRIMAMLTSKLLFEGRPSDEDEEQMFSAAQELNDKDLRTYARLFHGGSECEKKVHDSMTLSLMNVVGSIKTAGEQTVYAEIQSVTPHYLLRFANLGIIRKYERPYVDGDKAHVIATIPKPFELFVRFIDLATGPDDSPKTPSESD